MNNCLFETIKTKEYSLAEQTAEQISRLIAEQQLIDTDKLPSEFELAKMLNVGRGTIREGVKLLVARNVLEIRRGKGTYITSNPGEISDPLGFIYCSDQLQLAMDLLEIRSQLEPWAAKVAAERADANDLKRLCQVYSIMDQDILADQDYLKSDIRFHVAIAECTHNIVLPKLLHIMTYSIPLFISFAEKPLRRETLVNHREILDAICCKNGAEAAKAMVRHIGFDKVLMEKFIRKGT